jgi:hypothetical protein
MTKEAKLWVGAGRTYFQCDCRRMQECELPTECLLPWKWSSCYCLTWLNCEDCVSLSCRMDWVQSSCFYIITWPNWLFVVVPEVRIQSKPGEFARVFQKRLGSTSKHVMPSLHVNWLNQAINEGISLNQGGASHLSSEKAARRRRPSNGFISETYVLPMDCKCPPSNDQHYLRSW